MNMGILSDMARRDLSGRKNVETQRRLDLETVYERGHNEQDSEDWMV